MSFLFTQPQLLTEAATNLAGIGSSLTAANSAAALPTTSVLAAGADEVSTAMANVFGSHAQQYQQMSAQAANLHQQFVQAMHASGNAYAGAEAANAKPMAGNGATASGIGSQAQGLLGGPSAGRAGTSGAGLAGGSGNAGYRGGGRAVGAGAPVRTGGYAGGGTPVGRGGVGGAASAGLLSKPEPVLNRDRKGKAGNGFGAGGPGGRGDARDLRASFAMEDRSARSGFGSGGGGAHRVA
ncbi:PE family protein [Mycobacterium asiaticum]|uniref:PE domain-containing protein n=1 Tax=Mycobacterium asiaticum TaxID=1790 RepID=A0A1A3N5P5_MYCAS|nr:PE family protein [Mycobacterium asiaticum]OBK17126.1 hypothetical protein A5636_23735 [Mycobacterium asiaticum]